MINILVVDDKKSMRDMLAMMLREKGYRPLTKASAEDALEVLAELPIDIIITDLKMPGMGGLELLEEVRKRAPHTSVLLITAYGSIQDAVAAIKLGAVDFIEKPFPLEVMEEKIAQIIKKRHLKNTHSYRVKMGDIVGHGSATQNLYQLIEKVAPSDSSILIIGESGTGKELVAKEIHKYSLRKDQAFVAINCGALVETLLEDELFGHEKGAFTGAQRLKKGRFELADAGTLFLDEIAEMPVNLQVKLLRVLQENCLERVGGTSRVDIDVRIIAATNKDLNQLMQHGQFREDLYYRLNVITIEVPPLRDRKEDIALISEHFLARCNEKLAKEVRFDQDALAYLQAFSWPGNVRQLQNVIERGVVLAEGEWFTTRELPPEICKQLNLSQEPQQATNIVQQLECIEKEAIRHVLEKHDWNQTRAALELGIGRTALQYKMKKYEIGK